MPELRPEHVIVRRFGALVDTLERAEHELIAMAIILTLQHLQADFDRAVTPAEIEAAVRELAPDWAHNPILAIMDPQRTRADGYLEILEPMQLRLTPKAVLRLRVSLHYHRRL